MRKLLHFYFLSELVKLEVEIHITAEVCLTSDNHEHRQHMYDTHKLNQYASKFVFTHSDKFQFIFILVLTNYICTCVPGTVQHHFCNVFPCLPQFILQFPWHKHFLLLNRLNEWSKSWEKSHLVLKVQAVHRFLINKYSKDWHLVRLVVSGHNSSVSITIKSFQHIYNNSKNAKSLR